MGTESNQYLTSEEIRVSDELNSHLLEQIIHSSIDLESKNALQNFVDLLKKEKQSTDNNSTHNNPLIPNNLSSIPPPIEQVTRTHIPTDEAAYYLNRRPQTLRAWACFENGLIKPIRINGRLAWPVAELKKVLGMGCNYD